MKKLFFCIFLLYQSLTVIGQKDTCDCQKNKPTVFPLVLTGIGAIGMTDGSVDKAIRKYRNEKFSNFHNRADDYILYAPIVASYGLNLLGVKGKHNYKDLSLYTVTSLTMTTITVQALKYSIRRQRPDASARNSFPSGHTASAFCFATILHKEFGKKSKWYSAAGYAVATTVATMRVLNNKHWLSDVCAGAGLGMLSTELSYRWLDKYRQKHQPQKMQSFF
jgi:hypothetical protein